MITKSTWENYKKLKLHAPKYKRYGNRLLMASAVRSLALYQALSEIVDDKDYLSELAGDLYWKLYERDLKPMLYISGVLHRDPYKRLNFMGRHMAKHVFSPPEYKVNYQKKQDGFDLDFYRCPICDYFREHGEKELDFFRKTWCILDFALPDILQKVPATYERTKTLSSGDDMCNMKFRLSPPVS